MWAPSASSIGSAVTGSATVPRTRWNGAVAGDERAPCPVEEDAPGDGERVGAADADDADPAADARVAIAAIVSVPGLFIPAVDSGRLPLDARVRTAGS